MHSRSRPRRRHSSSSKGTISSCRCASRGIPTYGVGLDSNLIPFLTPAANMSLTEPQPVPLRQYCLLTKGEGASCAALASCRMKTLLLDVRGCISDVLCRC